MAKTKLEKEYEKYGTKELSEMVRQEAKSRGETPWDLAMGLSYAIFNTDGVSEQMIQFCCVAIYEMRCVNGLEVEDSDTLH